MTARFAILVRGDDARRRTLATAITRTTGVPIAAELSSGLILADKIYRPGGPDGPIVIGQMFNNAGIGCAQRGAGCWQSPPELMTKVWGSYVVVFDDGERGLRVLRDPSGAVPCYYHAAAGPIVIASDLELLKLPAGSRQTLNWNEIGRLLVEVDLRGPETGLAQTLELLPGTMLTIRPAATLISECWSPWDHAREPSGSSFDEQAAVLRERITTVIAALVAGHGCAIASVSGGLDSSIVALTLAGRADLTCMTLATQDPGGDERRYARLVAAATASHYREHMLSVDAVALGQSQAAHLPRPIGRPFLLPMMRAFEQAIASAEATAVFNGTGGDNVFCFLQSATPAADRLTNGGLFSAAGTVGDIATLTGASYSRVARAAVRRALRGRRPRPWRRDPRFVCRELAHDVASYAHPWLQPPASVRLGTGAHVLMLLRVQNYVDRWATNWPAEVVNPLLAQPIVEHCLSIPSWEWCRDGIDRSVARAAFADRLPPAIMRRTWKGGPDGFIVEIVDRNRATLRSLLADGVLAAHGLIDRDAIGAALDYDRPIVATDALRLLLLVDAEAWVRHHG